MTAALIVGGVFVGAALAGFVAVTFVRSVVADARQTRDRMATRGDRPWPARPGAPP